MWPRAALTLATIAILAAACTDTTARDQGSIYLAVNVQSDEPLSFNYDIRVDGLQHNEVAFGRVRMTLPSLAPGRHMISMANVPSICAGAEAREVTVQAGEQTTVVVTLNCSRAYADLLVHVTTTGYAPDFDGYDLLLNGSRISRLGDGDKLVRFQPVGSHTLSIGSVADACVVSDPVPLRLTAGVRAEASFRVTCTPTGVVRIVPDFSGIDRDPDGFVVTFDGTRTFRSALDNTADRRIPVGVHSFSITDIAPNCPTSSARSGTANLSEKDTIIIKVSATCSSIGMGSVSSVVSDAVGDTLDNPARDSSTRDITSVTVRRAPNWVILVLHVTPGPINTSGGGVPLYGNIDLDTDESPATGSAPFINLFGGHATQGAEYSVILNGDLRRASFIRTFATPDTSARVRLVSAGDSVVVFVPLTKLGGDDGNLTASIMVGGPQRPSDIAPTTGAIVVRPPPP